MSGPLTGTCLCGTSRFTAVPTTEVEACHCSRCRKWTGGMFLAVACGSSVEFAADAPITIYDSSPWAERVFCAICGSSLVWRTKDGHSNIVSIQTFIDPAQFALTKQIYIDDKPANYALANQTRLVTGAEIEAMYASKEMG